MKLETARPRTAVVTLVLGEVDANAAPIEVVRIQVSLRTLGCWDVEILAKSEAFLPTRVFVRDDPADHRPISASGSFVCRTGRLQPSNCTTMSSRTGLQTHRNFLIGPTSANRSLSWVSVMS